MNKFAIELKKYLLENPGATARETTASGSSASPGSREKGKSVENTYELFKNGMSIEDISQRRGLAPSTIASHLGQAIRAGLDLDIDRLVNPAKQEEIGAVFLRLGKWELKPIIEHFGGAVSYEEAGLVRAWLQRKKTG